MLTRLASLLDGFAETTGKVLGLLPLILVLVQFAVVLSVYIFRLGSIELQESLQYINALMFLGAAGYTALHDEHVRVDIFYSRLGPRGKAMVNLFGTLFMLIPFLILFWMTALPFVEMSWTIREASVDAGGLPFVYILKATLLLFALTLSLQATSILIRSALTLRKGAA
ncbi:TRAP transporter small permease subunit [Gimibacter soli]|uniref:TRAP transporter small permease protein n=1 Tax=Gimibacter soli TaxID=3024400 RepID=A0AAE9XXT8_9PROT|nr:TRAP transporter small permease subunit [Gimibacter soli]WCL55749.1 TRAP transporter small permease subunit [Gimibacter soli]